MEATICWNVMVRPTTPNEDQSTSSTTSSRKATVSTSRTRWRSASVHPARSQIARRLFS
jgi:hypothetical protein